MTLKERLDSDYLNSMREKDALTVSTLRLIKTAIKNAEIEAKSELDEAGIIAVLDKQAKQRKDSIDQYEKAGRDDLKEVEEAELAVIEKYLPEKLSYEEVKESVSAIISGLDDSEKNFGKVMGAAMADLKGKADPKDVQSAIKELLGS